MYTLPSGGVTKLSPFQEFMFVMLKLWIDLPLEFLPSQFKTSLATASRIFMKWLKQMDLWLQDTIIWPEQDSLQKTIYLCVFKHHLEKRLLIIDCFEIFRQAIHFISTC